MRVRLWPGLPGTAHDVLVTRQLLGADRAACVDASGRDADLGTHAELAAVGELRRCVVQNNRAVDFP